MGGGSTSQSSSSRPLTPEERTAGYQAAMQNILGTNMNAPTYQAPTYQGSTFQGGDYTSGIDYDKTKSQQALDANAAKRGVWSSGLAQKQTIDNNNAYSGAYAQAGVAKANATNAFNQQEAGTRNTFNLQNADKKYQSDWAPLNYLQGTWNGTGGAVSSGSGGGWNFSI